MKYLFKGIAKFFVANIAVIFTIMILPVFLITDSVSIYDDVMNFLFNNRSQ